MTETKWAFEIPGKLEIPYRYFAGAFSSRWFRALRDEKKILGCRCPTCRKVFVPPRGNCERCLTKIEEWVELPGTGTVESFTVVRYAEPFQPKKPPFVLAAIKLDGADSALIHLVGGISPDRVRVGLRVRAVFAEERKGRITDISHFQPVAEGKPKAAYHKPSISKAKPKGKAKPRIKTRAKARVRKATAKKSLKRSAKKAVRTRTAPRKASAKRAKSKKASRAGSAGRKKLIRRKIKR